MREILFKAKRKDNGEWVEGLLAFMSKINLLAEEEIETENVLAIQNFMASSVEIDESTICQYTGLTDKNGNKIWENDVVSFCDDIYKIVWDEDDARFALEDESVIESFNNIEGKWCEVIGNIFDNPELLEGGAE